MVAALLIAHCGTSLVARLALTRCCSPGAAVGAMLAMVKLAVALKPMCGEMGDSVASKDCSKGNCSPTTESSRDPDQPGSETLKGIKVTIDVIIWQDTVQQGMIVAKPRYACTCCVLLP
jgi:hypothetical protein